MESRLAAYRRGNRRRASPRGLFGGSIVFSEGSAMKREYHEGPEAKKRFEEGMTTLFRVPKSTAKKPEKPVRKKSTKVGKD
jgi:hypothetical protein